MKITKQLRERFCKEASVPAVILEEPMFTERIKLLDPYYDSWHKWIVFTSSLERYKNQEEYFADYKAVKEKAIQDIKNSQGYQKFNQIDMNEYPIYKGNLPGKTIYRDENDKKLLLSIDMITANFTALKYFDDSIFGEADTWEDFISRYTSNRHFIESKYTRQVILGNCNLKRHITYEKYLMSGILEYVFSLGIEENKIMFFSNDEIVIDITELGKDYGDYLSVKIKSKYEKEGIPLRTETFCLHKIHGVDGWYKEIFCRDRFNNPQTKIRIKGTAAEMLPFIIRILQDEPIHMSDKMFYSYGKLAKFEEVPSINI